MEKAPKYQCTLPVQLECLLKTPTLGIYLPVSLLLQASVLQNLRLAMRRQIRRHSTRRSTSSSSRRRLEHLWSRLFHSEGRASRHVPLLDPPAPTQITLGLHSYRTVGEQGPQARARSGAGFGDEVDMFGMPGSCCSANMDMQPCMSESPASPLSYQSLDSPEEDELSPVCRERSRAPQFELPTPGQTDSSNHSQPSTPQEASASMCHPRASRKLVLELAVNLKGVSLRRYTPLGPLSPISPPVFPSSSQTPTTQPHTQGLEGTSPTEPSSSSVQAEDSASHCTVDMPSREIKSREKSMEERRREGKSRLYRLSRTLSDEEGDSGRAST